ncbi:UNVERIFIED_CONTAM: hypothetical protein PYX00_005447 [Menopon gallinae]|uniref:Uncharacterized protein n=1 Tax=Menopon gallinae TaxID=328185 RepID=A0AAW2HRF2_9NEOP
MKKDLEQVQKSLDGPAPIVVMISAEQIQFLKLAEEPPVYVENRDPDEQKAEQDHLGVMVVPKTTPTTVEMVKVVEATLSSDANATTETTEPVHSSNSTDLTRERVTPACACYLTVESDSNLTAFVFRTSMKFAVCLLGVLLCAGLSSAFPQKDGAIFSNEAIRQAQSTFLIPRDAQIQKVQEGIEVAAYENLPGNQAIDLFQILGDQVPPEVVSNLQKQVEQIGKQ